MTFKFSPVTIFRGDIVYSDTDNDYKPVNLWFCPMQSGGITLILLSFNCRIFNSLLNCNWIVRDNRINQHIYQTIYCHHNTSINYSFMTLEQVPEKGMQQHDKITLIVIKINKQYKPRKLCCCKKIEQRCNNSCFHGQLQKNIYFETECIWLFKVIQGHWSGYQSKAFVKLPISNQQQPWFYHVCLRDISIAIPLLFLKKKFVDVPLD